MESTPTPVPHIRKLRLAGGRKIALTAELGRGSLGAVYAGTIYGAIGAHRLVAVKVYEDLSSDGRERDHLLAGIARAASATACVCDPRIVQVYDYDLSSPTAPFVVSELVDGGSLETFIDGFERQDKQLPQDVAILIGLKVAEGLEGALRSRLPDGAPTNLVHGSLCARDVLVSWGGEVKVKGLGMWQAALGASMKRPLESMARLAGTAPEIARGQAPDPRSDVFSLGMLLRRMLLGQRFSPHTSPADAIRLVYDGVVHASLHEANLLGPLRAVLRRATAPRASDRYAHAGEVAAELRRIANLMGIPDVPAFIAHAVEDAFMPELARKSEREAQGREERIVEAVAEIVPTSGGYEAFAYGDVVEIAPSFDKTAPLPAAKSAPRLLAPAREREPEPAPGPDHDPCAETEERTLPPPSESTFPGVGRSSAPTEITRVAPPKLGPTGLSSVPKSPPRPELKPLRPRQQSGVDFRGLDLDNAPTIVSDSNWFDDL